jgi:hypothetical protein
MNPIHPTPAARRPVLLFPLALALAGACLLMSAAVPAQARERHVTVTGPHGQSAQRHVARSHGDVSSSTTGPNGKTTSRSVDRSASGTTATVTGANGKTATRSTTRSAGSKQTTVTGPDGQTVTRSVTRQP